MQAENSKFKKTTTPTKYFAPNVQYRKLETGNSSTLLRNENARKYERDSQKSTLREVCIITIPK